MRKSEWIMKTSLIFDRPTGRATAVLISRQLLFSIFNCYAWFQKFLRFFILNSSTRNTSTFCSKSFDPFATNFTSTDAFLHSRRISMKSVSLVARISTFNSLTWFSKWCWPYDARALHSIRDKNHKFENPPLQICLPQKLVFYLWNIPLFRLVIPILYIQNHLFERHLVFRVLYFEEPMEDHLVLLDHFFQPIIFVPCLGFEFSKFREKIFVPILTGQKPEIKPFQK